MNRADCGQPVLGLVVANRVPSCEDGAGFGHFLGRGVENRANRLQRHLLRESGHRDREERGGPHRVDVVECVGGRNRPEGGRIIDHRREEVGGEDERAVVVEAVDGRVVGGR
jgi:hypothetical protein